jgi:hypothetical protein
MSAGPEEERDGRWLPLSQELGDHSSLMLCLYRPPEPQEGCKGGKHFFMTQEFFLGKRKVYDRGPETESQNTLSPEENR